MSKLKMRKESNSPRFSLDSNDILDIARNTGLVALAAGLTYLGENIGDLDLGNASALVVPIAVIVINTIVNWAKNNTDTE